MIGVNSGVDGFKYASNGIRPYLNTGVISKRLCPDTVNLQK